MTIDIIPIKPKPGPSHKQFEIVFRAAIADILEKVEVELKDAVSTWSEKSQPSFRVKIGKGPIRVGGESFGAAGELVGVLYTSSVPYVYVIGGTSWRARKMHPNYTRKSFANSLAKSAGGAAGPVGRPIYRLPGISARNHHILVAEQNRGTYSKSMETAAKAGAYKAFPG